MAEIHKAREIIYEKTKGMTAREKLTWIHRETETAKKKYNLQLSEANR